MLEERINIAWSVLHHYNFMCTSLCKNDVDMLDLPFLERVADNRTNFYVFKFRKGVTDKSLFNKVICNSFGVYFIIDDIEMTLFSNVEMQDFISLPEGERTETRKFIKIFRQSLTFLVKPCLTEELQQSYMHMYNQSLLLNGSLQLIHDKLSDTYSVEDINVPKGLGHFTKRAI